MKTVRTFKAVIYNGQALPEGILCVLQTVPRLVRFITEEVGSTNRGECPLLLSMISDRASQVQVASLVLKKKNTYDA